MKIFPSPCEFGGRPDDQQLLRCLIGSTGAGILLPNGQETEMKECTKCHVVKGLEDFSKNRTKSGGLSNECKACDKERNAKWKAENREKYKESRSRYYAENRDRLLAETARWRAINPEKERAGRLRHYAQNRDRVLAARVQYCAANPDKIAQNHIIRHARIQQASVPWADREAIAAIYRLRDKIIEETGMPHHVDHVIPLKSKFVCGLHVHNNLQVIPATENLKKGNRLSCG